MPTFPDLAQRITHAHKQLLVARQDEDAVKQLFWSGERNHLLDEYSARTPNSPEENPVAVK